MSSATTTEILPPSPAILRPATTPPTYGKINYIPANHTPLPSPHNFHLPPISSFSDSRILPLHDLRPLPTLSQLSPSTLDIKTKHASLSTHNFTALHHPSSLHATPYSYANWKDPRLLREIYVPETEALVRHITGAKKVVTEALLLRSVLWTEEDALATHAGHGTKSSRSGANLEQRQEQDSKTETAAESASENETSTSTSTSFPQFIGFDASTGGASPAPKVHQDYTPRGARTHIRYYHPALTAAASEIIAAQDAVSDSTNASASSDSPPPPPRWALYSIWRPLKPVQRDPLALCDARSVREEDFVPIMVRTPTLGSTNTHGTETHDCEAWLARVGGSDVRGVRLGGKAASTQEANEEKGGHEWYWVSAQKPEEVLVIGLFDSARESHGKGAGGTMHSSVELVGATGEEEARESLELRCLAVW